MNESNVFVPTCSKHAETANHTYVIIGPGCMHVFKSNTTCGAEKVDSRMFHINVNQMSV